MTIIYSPPFGAVATVTLTPGKLPTSDTPGTLDVWVPNDIQRNDDFSAIASGGTVTGLSFSVINTAVTNPIRAASVSVLGAHLRVAFTYTANAASALLEFSWSIGDQVAFGPGTGNPWGDSVVRDRIVTAWDFKLAGVLQVAPPDHQRCIVNIAP